METPRNTLLSSYPPYIPSILPLYFFIFLYIPSIILLYSPLYSLHIPPIFPLFQNRVRETSSMFPTHFTYPLYIVPIFHLYSLYIIFHVLLLCCGIRMSLVFIGFSLGLLRFHWFSIVFICFGNHFIPNAVRTDKSASATCSWSAAHS